jgi:hypothetical protein
MYTMNSHIKRNQEDGQPEDAPPLTLEREVEMPLHAYKYVRDVDPDGETGAADLLWSRYKELKGR